jgi:hypothetical protein
MALAELCSGVTVQLQHLGQRRGRIGPHRAIPRRRRRDLRDPAHSSRVMVAAGQQRLPRRGTQRGRMETVVPQAVRGQPLGGRRLARTPERARRAEPRVVDQHDQHVRRTRRRTQRLDRRERRIRVLRVIGHQTHVRPVRDRQIRSRQIAPHLIDPPAATRPTLSAMSSAINMASPVRPGDVSQGSGRQVQAERRRCGDRAKKPFIRHEPGASHGHRRINVLASSTRCLHRFPADNPTSKRQVPWCAGNSLRRVCVLASGD